MQRERGTLGENTGTRAHFIPKLVYRQRMSVSKQVPLRGWDLSLTHSGLDHRITSSPWGNFMILWSVEFQWDREEDERSPKYGHWKYLGPQLVKVLVKLGKNSPGSPEVKDPPSNAEVLGLIPDQRTKISHTRRQLSQHCTTGVACCNQDLTQLNKLKKIFFNKIRKSLGLALGDHNPWMSNEI